MKDTYDIKTEGYLYSACIPAGRTRKNSQEDIVNKKYYKIKTEGYLYSACIPIEIVRRTHKKTTLI